MPARDDRPSEDPGDYVRLPRSVTKAVDSVHSVAIHAPHLIALILLVGVFLLYLNRHEEHEAAEDARMDMLADLRITACHDIQDRGVETMDRLASVMERHEATFRHVYDEQRATQEQLKRLIQMLDDHLTDHDHEH